MAFNKTLYYQEYRKAHPEKHAEYARRCKLKAAYGLSLEEYDQMVAAQDGRCMMCGTDKPKGQGRRFHVDHDHATGRVRALLCSPCNISLGHYEKKRDMIHEYLEATNGV